ncbi:hypothetical protein BSZ35_13160 [Salinibacter sp. 10B]|nr:hypothetical protein BSZ35_13160 [Salinibacter sp. 10B]
MFVRPRRFFFYLVGSVVLAVGGSLLFVFSVQAQQVAPEEGRVPEAAPVSVHPSIPVRALAPSSLAIELPPVSSASSSGVRWGRVTLVSGILTTSYVSQYVIERKKWWSQQTVGFHFDSKLEYAHGLDKMAHFYGAEIQAMTNARLLEWAGVSSSKAALAGSLLSLAGQTNVEIHDGFNAQWGFDVYDQIANVLGVSWFYAHERVPALRRFDVRLSYWHPNAPPLNKSKDITPFTNDYSGHVYWVSMRVWDLLPASAQPYWPRWLQISAGVSLNKWEEYPDPDAYLSTHISVDVDWRKIIPRGSWLGRTTGDLLNRYHLPAPALQITPRPGIRLLFVGQ